jgi:uncharacterized protein (UPF0179 family)
MEKKKYVIIRVENLPYRCEIGEDESVAVELGEFETFADAVASCKKHDGLFGKIYSSTIVEDMENEIFEFKNARGRYENDTFKLETEWNY